MGAGQNHLLFNCDSIPQGSLHVPCSMDMHLVGFANNLQLSSESVYQDYLKDYQTRTYYNMSYTAYMDNFMETLIVQANYVEPSYSDIINTTSFFLSNPLVTPPDMTQMEQIASSTSEDIRVNVDNNCPDKSRGFLNHSKAQFTFVGPDREPVLILDINQCVVIAKLVQETGKPNYAVARVPLVSNLNFEAWQQHLIDYHDQYLFQYLKFGLPCLVNHAVSG